MENQTTQPTEQSPISQPIIIQEKQKTNLKAFAVVILLCVTFGLGGYYFGTQSTRFSNDTVKLQNTTLPAPIPNESNLTVNNKILKQPTDACSSTFTSKYLDLSFKFNNCVWSLEENLITPEKGVYSEIVAIHKSNYRVVIRAESMGMGGGYPWCAEVSDIALLEDDVVRIHMVQSSLNQVPKYYHYLNAKNDYAIKGYPGKYGDEKFNEYFTFLNPDVFQNTNMCWRGSGINPVAMLQPKMGETESYLVNKDIVILIEEENVSNKEFLTDADNIAVSIYSNLNK